MLEIISPAAFQKKVLTWFDQHGRKTLPWQQNKTPYRVWISEVMLQQTQVSTVIAYFERFMQCFPTVESLAHATEDEVLHVWTGLGYYSRARNLHRSAKIIAHDRGGQFPDTLEELQSLPGIGRSTAGAILAIAFQQRATILDGNVKRVLTRVAGIKQWPGEKKVNDHLWQLAESFTPQQRIADYTQAMMDLGAMICVRGKPHCARCPILPHCSASTLGLTKHIPAAKPKKQLPVRQATLLILQYQQQVFLKKRPTPGIWGGLWSLPEVNGLAVEEDILAYCRQQLHLSTARLLHYGDRFRHTFSHFHLDILPVFLSVKTKPAKITDSDDQIWYVLNDAQTVGLPAPIKKILRSLSNAHDLLSEIK